MNCNVRKVKQRRLPYVDIKCTRCGTVMRTVRTDVFDVLKREKEYRKMLKSGLCDKCRESEVQK